MDQFTYALTELLKSGPLAQYAAMVVPAFVLLHFVAQFIFMPTLTPAEKTDKYAYRLFFQIVSLLAGNYGKNTPVPNSNLIEPRK